ncbi:MAG: hypothetical protein V7740_16845 [Pseudomonas marincola]
MFNAVSKLLKPLFGGRGSSLSVPILDGAFKPNNLLEQAPVYAEHPGFEDIAVGPDGDLYAACGSDVVKIPASGDLIPVSTFDQTVTALAFLPDGSMAVGLGTSVAVNARTKECQIISSADGKPFVAVTALQATPDGSLLICDGSEAQPYPEWSRDLMEKGSSGRLLRYDPQSSEIVTLASGLAYSFGAYVDAQNRVLVSESWRHRISIVDKAQLTPAISDLPGYPGRITAADGGGFWLSLFACRTQLVEFVLRENDYRQEMMDTIEPKYWVAPALSSGSDFLEPLQGGSVKQMGVLKPWAPPRSYGLVVRLDDNFKPLFSLHSRVGGQNHGIVSTAQRGDELFALSKGAGRILRLSVSQIETTDTLEVTT